MQGNLAILGAGSRVGRMLAQVWAERTDVTWLSRDDWRAEDGAKALRPLLAGAGAVLCLSGAANARADLRLNPLIGRAVCAAAPDSAHVFLASSQAVYAASAGPHSEDGPTEPAGAYGASKLEMECACAALRDRVTALRLGNVVGADLLGRNIAAGRALTLDVFSNGQSPRRSYLNISGLGLLLDALFRRSVSDAPLPRAVNVARAPALEMAALTRAAKAEFDTRPAPEGVAEVVEMDLARLFDLVPGLADPITAEQAVADWMRFAPI